MRGTTLSTGTIMSGNANPVFYCRVGYDSRVTIPAEIREAHSIREGDILILSLASVVPRFRRVLASEQW
ncbi:MAG: AbrB/MazE/SpoVT family DNA-binding domain-containing protein [Thermoproteota archaeon]